MMAPANRDTGVEVGLPFVFPRCGVVDVHDPALAGREGAAPAVPELDRTSLRAGPRPALAADVEHFTLAADDDAADPGVTRQASSRFAAERNGTGELCGATRSLAQGAVIDGYVHDRSFRIDLASGCEVRESSLEQLDERVGTALRPCPRSDRVFGAGFT